MVAVVAEEAGEAPGFLALEKRWQKWKEQVRRRATLGKGKSQTDREYPGHCSSEVVLK